MAPGPIRLLFLSDTHLGLDLPARPRIDRPRRGHDLLRCYEAALAPARAGLVDAVVHGGDLLYRSRVAPWLVEAALAPLRALAATGVPVVLVPGNHERGRVPFPLLARQEGLHLLDRPRTVTLRLRGLDLAFSGFPYAHDVRSRFPALLAEARREAPPAALSLLVLHQCVEGATCGPADHVFRDAPDVVRRADLPADAAAVLCGHVHRAQVLRAPGRPPVIYCGSVERTSFAEAGERKGCALLELDAAGLRRVAFRPLPARPMVEVALRLEGLGPAGAREAILGALASTPPGALVRLRPQGPVPAALGPLLGAAALRALAGDRLPSVARPRGPGRAAKEERPPRGRRPSRSGEGENRTPDLGIMRPSL